MGLFITFEGIDGCGKSTQIKLLHKNLVEHGYSTVLTREPGGTSISEKVRNLILGRENAEMSDKCELLLYLAARAQHVEEKILPAMSEGKVVLSDRFEEATFAYQGYGRNIGLDTILPLNSYATGGLTPDLTFILDISPEVSKKRFSLSGKIRDRLELNDTDFFERIRLGYKKRVFSRPLQIIEINGELSVEEIEHKIFLEVLRRIKSKHLSLINEQL